MTSGSSDMEALRQHPEHVCRDGYPKLGAPRRLPEMPLLESCCKAARRSDQRRFEHCKATAAMSIVLLVMALVLAAVIIGGVCLMNDADKER